MLDGEYEGDLVGGLRHGKGRLVFVNGDRYEGAFRKGFRHGKGTFTSWKDEVYEGEWVAGRRQGKGRMVYYSGNCVIAYEGDFVRDSFHGEGSLLKYLNTSREAPSSDQIDSQRLQSRYEGQFYNGMKHGKGKMEFVTKKCMYEGEWKNGAMDGDGKYVQEGHGEYEGQWLNGLRHGFGKEVCGVGLKTEVYEGSWKEGKRHGVGLLIKNGFTRQGEWADNIRLKWIGS